MLQSILFYQQALLRSESNSDHSKMKNLRKRKKSLEKSNVLKKSAKLVKQKKNCIQTTNTFTIIPTNFVRDQLKNNQIQNIEKKAVHINVKMLHVNQKK